MKSCFITVGFTVFTFCGKLFIASTWDSQVCVMTSTDMTWDCWLLWWLLAISKKSYGKKILIIFFENTIKILESKLSFCFYMKYFSKYVQSHQIILTYFTVKHKISEKICLDCEKISITVTLLIQDIYSSEIALNKFPIYWKSRSPGSFNTHTQMLSTFC